MDNCDNCCDPGVVVELLPPLCYTTYDDCQTKCQGQVVQCEPPSLTDVCLDLTIKRAFQSEKQRHRKHKHEGRLSFGISSTSDEFDRGNYLGRERDRNLSNKRDQKLARKHDTTDDRKLARRENQLKRERGVQAGRPGVKRELKLKLKAKLDTGTKSGKKSKKKGSKSQLSKKSKKEKKKPKGKMLYPEDSDYHEFGGEHRSDWEEGFQTKTTKLYSKKEQKVREKAIWGESGNRGPGPSAAVKDDCRKKDDASEMTMEEEEEDATVLHMTATDLLGETLSEQQLVPHHLEVKFQEKPDLVEEEGEAEMLGEGGYSEWAGEVEENIEAIQQEIENEEEPGETTPGEKETEIVEILRPHRDELEEDSGGSDKEKETEAEGVTEDPSVMFINDMKETDYSEHTLLENEIVAPELFIVWQNVARFIAEKLSQGQAVKIPGLGTFTHHLVPNDYRKATKNCDEDECVENDGEDEDDAEYSGEGGGRSRRRSNFRIKEQRRFPVFRLCPHLKQVFSLREVDTAEIYFCNAPSTSLNYQVLACRCKMSPGIVEGFVSEVLRHFSRGIITGKNVEFPIPFIGKFYIDSSMVFMIFYREFCQKLLNFDYQWAEPLYQFTVFPGSMTPIMKHKSSPEFQSVFHYPYMRAVGQGNTRIENPRVYDQIFQDKDKDEPEFPTRKETEHPCVFKQNLFEHSKIPFNFDGCVKMSNEILGEGEVVAEDDEDELGEVEQEEMEEDEDDPYQLKSKWKIHPNRKKWFEERVRRGCMAPPASTRKFSFLQSDGSFYTPEPLYTPVKTGDRKLDKLVEDECHLQKILRCWMKRGFLNTLGAQTLAKHYDRDYFRRATSTPESWAGARLSSRSARRNLMVCLDSPSLSETPSVSTEEKILPPPPPTPPPSTAFEEDEPESPSTIEEELPGEEDHEYLGEFDEEEVEVSTENTLEAPSSGSSYCTTSSSEEEDENDGDDCVPLDDEEEEMMEINE